MRSFIHTKLWNMLCEPCNANNGFDTALSEFAVDLQTYCRGESSLAERTRTLRFARSELEIARQYNGAGEK